MNNKDLLLERILMNMKYDSKMTLSENKILLSEDGPTPLTFDGPNPLNLSSIVKWTTIGKILSKVSNNLSILKEFSYDGDIMIIKGKKYLQYDEGAIVTRYKPSVTNCISETYSTGRAKSWDMACYKNYHANLDNLEKQRHTFCLSKILNNQGLLNMPFAIQVNGTKMDQYGESKDGIYKIYFFLNGEDCTFGGFNYYYDSGNDYNYLNTDHALTPLKGQSASKPKEQPKPIKKIVQKNSTENLTQEQQKKWCADRGKVWSDEVNACIGKEITVKASEVQIKPKEKEKESQGGVGPKGTEGKGVEKSTNVIPSKDNNQDPNKDSNIMFDLEL